MLTFPLGAGTLAISPTRAELPLDHLCGFAERYDAGRGYSVVSKVLGKNYPACPEFMAQVHRRLAAQLPVPLDGPVVFVALAETAINLGAAVYQEYRAAAPQTLGWFVQTSRYGGPGPLVTFQEAHSHAPQHFLRLPTEPSGQALWAQARTLVLVDDEVTTGRTFYNLAQALMPTLPQVRQIFGLSLTSWLAPDAPLRRQLPRPTHWLSLWEGSCSYQGPPRPGPPERHRGLEPIMAPPSPLRAGCQTLPNFPEKWLSGLPSAPQKVMVLGTGEFMVQPYLFARRLARAGHQVALAATTRSPLHPGGIVGHKLTFVDNYGEGISNYLYNVDPARYDLILVAYETLQGPSPLAQALGPKLKVLP